MNYVVLIVFGLCLGSFVNALIWRIHKQAEITGEFGDEKKVSKADSEQLEKLSISKGRSMCLSCGHELAGKDLVPVLSWLQLRGKCRYCKAPIPDTPLAELLVPLLFVISYAVWPDALTSGWAIAAFVTWLACLVAFVALAFYDIRWFLLPDRIVFPLIGISVIQLAVTAFGSGRVLSTLVGGIAGVAVVAGVFFALHELSKGQWIGFGDVKLAIALGLLAGSALQGMMVIFFASVLGLVLALPGLARGKMAATSKIPFGPFLLLATVIVVLYGGAIADWYLRSLVY